MPLPVNGSREGEASSRRRAKPFPGNIDIRVDQSLNRRLFYVGCQSDNGLEVSKNYTRGTGRGYSGATFGGGSQTAEVIALKKLRNQKIEAARREGQHQMAQLLKLRNANPENVRRQAELKKEAADIEAREKVRKSFARGNQLAEAFKLALKTKK
jgi:hypothetical protein